MKKLLLIGSSTIHTYNYLQLIKDYFDEIVLITDKKREGYNYKIIELDFSLKKISNLLNTPRSISKIIADFKPSVIHIHQINSFAFYGSLSTKKFSIPVILTAWGSDILLLPYRSWLMKQMVKFNLRQATAYTSDSIFMADEMRKLFPSKKMDILIANFGIGIDVIEREKENIIYSNRLHKKLYRIDKIIYAFKRFINNDIDNNWKLVIAATGEETEKLKQLVAQLKMEDKVTFVGWLNKEQNAEWYAKAKLFVSIPESDATAISLLEAMACGCLPVLSNLPANKEWVEDGKNGLIVKNIDSDFLSDALNIEMNKAALLNKNIIISHGTRDANQKKFIELYSKVKLK